MSLMKNTTAHLLDNCGCSVTSTYLAQRILTDAVIGNAHNISNANKIQFGVSCSVAMLRECEADGLRECST